MAASKQFNIGLSSETVDRLEKIRAAEIVSTGYPLTLMIIVRRAISEFIERQEAK